MNPKISIIVPVYKVEKYIHKCIDSILAQTFTDFELILVDDGSPDNCGKICDEYVKKDRRIKVIHKNSTIYFKNKTVVNGGHDLIIHEREEAMKTMLEGRLYDEVVWVKLFKRELFDDVRFPVGKIYEDTAVTYRLIDKSNRVGCIGKAKYNYIKRDGSVMDNAIKNIRLDAIDIYNEMYEFINLRYPKLTDLVALKFANSCMIVLNLIINTNRFTTNKDDYYNISKKLNAKFNRTITLNDYPVNVKVLLLLNKIHPNLYRMAINFIERRA